MKNNVLKILGVLVFAILIVISLLILLSNSGERATPRAITLTQMEVYKMRIMEYSLRNGRLPNDLNLIRVKDDEARYSLDGWGNPIAYRFDSNGVVTLSSYGKDASPGGSGDATDIVGVFKAYDTNGAMAEPNAPWIKNPSK